jgi:RimJ/RimL family protein N-acetyltransferase
LIVTRFAPIGPRDLGHHARVSTAGDAPPIAAPLGDVTTERLDLRRFDGSDLDELAEVFSHREVWEFPYGRALTRAETATFLDAQIDHWDTYAFGCWVARTLHDQRIVGYVGLSVPTFLPEILPAVEVGWRFAPAAWGNGYATEGAGAALDQAFTTLRLERVCSVPQAGNPASARVAERLGMTLSRRVSIPADERRGAVIGLLYEIEPETWQRGAAQSPTPQR